MCTVTYLPKKDGFIITSNRDERLLRKVAETPRVTERGVDKILFPKDGEAGGTWICTSQSKRTVCLLNGAFVPHIRQLPYRKSRGLVVLDFFKTVSVLDFAKDYDLDGIEPFTMVIAEDKKLYELRWDGKNKFFKPLEEKQPHIRCSVTLYTPEVIAMREQWFENWLAVHKNYLVHEILLFHLFAGEGDDSTKIRMSRAGIVKTVSITCIEQSGNKQNMYYSDLKGENNFYFGSYSFEGNESEKGLSIAAPYS
jgi:hypothetical protein